MAAPHRSGHDGATGSANAAVLPNGGPPEPFALDSHGERTTAGSHDHGGRSERMQRRNALRVLLALLAGVVVFGLGTVVVTEALDPFVWPSLLVGLPVGVVLGASATLITYVGEGYRVERRDTGTVSARTRRRLRATLAAVGGGVVVGGAGVALLANQAVGVALALLVGLGLGLAGGVVSGSVVWFRGRDGWEEADADRTRG